MTLSTGGHSQTIRREKRRSRCGAPYTMLRESGRSDDVRFYCGDKYDCESCRRRYSQRVYACVKSALTGSTDAWGDNDVVMLTLTHATAHTRAEAVERCHEHWRRTTTKIRWYRRACRKVGEWEEKHGHSQRWWRLRDWREKRDDCAEDIAPLRRDGRVIEETREGFLPRASEWSEENGWGDVREKIDFVRVTEVHKSGPGRWHAHLHLATSDLKSAQMLQAAWQRTREDYQPTLETGAVAFCQTTIKRLGEHVEQTAKYLCKYVTKCAASANHRGVRWLDAGGDYRPLGLRYPPCQDPPVEIIVRGYSADPAAFFAGQGLAFAMLVPPAKTESDSSKKKPPDRTG